MMIDKQRKDTSAWRIRHFSIKPRHPLSQWLLSKINQVLYCSRQAPAIIRRLYCTILRLHRDRNQVIMRHGTSQRHRHAGATPAPLCTRDIRQEAKTTCIQKTWVGFAPSGQRPDRLCTIPSVCRTTYYPFHHPPNLSTRDV